MDIKRRLERIEKAVGGQEPDLSEVVWKAYFPHELEELGITDKDIVGAWQNPHGEGAEVEGK